ncbi:class I SAM-dependent methyltransferase [Embleya hyalina]|uniref:Methyltransferase n=1 Tax=Embleya hyalina TaxID=516124 RepID=A0A401Z1S8_9ACTN|nr:class I SAM-dependent methyltransferase [Embleya hyalina]GCE00788.1 methyltransferase [Embleya hyalina]
MTTPLSVDTIRVSYDTVAADYARILSGELDVKPLDRAMLAAFGDLVGAGDVTGPVADVGCGPGRIAAHLHALGVDVFGVDLSPAMVTVARRAHPHLEFREGSMAALDVEGDSLAGVVAWYSTVHTPPAELPDIYREFHRVLVPGGHVLLAFKVGEGKVRLHHAYGHTVDLDVYRFPVDATAAMLRAAGFDEVARLVREPDPEEKTPQAFLIARKPPLPN